MSQYNPIFVFIQEHWLPNHEASNKFKSDFQTHNFLTTSEDMFTHTEDLLLKAGPVWHGTAVGWAVGIEKYVTHLPIVSDRFCGIQYNDAQSDTIVLVYSVYFPTAGKDNDFLEVLSSLNLDIHQHNTNNTVLLIGCDSNQSSKSTSRRTSAMDLFLKELNLKSKVSVDFLKHICLKDNPSNLSAHDVIVGKINLPVISTVGLLNRGKLCRKLVCLQKEV